MTENFSGTKGQHYNRQEDIHKIYGGQPQSGIVPSKHTNEIFLFTTDRGAANNGYSEQEGWEDKKGGNFHYTAQGSKGDQDINAWPNRVLASSRADGKILHLFQKTNSQESSYEYLGQFQVQDPAYSETTISDSEGNPRKGYIFHLSPSNTTENNTDQSQDHGKYPIKPWQRPNSDPYEVTPSGHKKQVTQTEHELQVRFGNWLLDQGETVTNIPLKTDGSTIFPDLYIASRKEVVEAKKQATRGYVRAALAQALDYVFIAKRNHNIDTTPAALFPDRPSDELIALLKHHGVKIYFENKHSFESI